MKRALRMAVRIGVFIGVFAAGVRPSWWMMERFWTRDVSANPDAHIAILVRRPDQGNRYAVGDYAFIRPESRLVTQFADSDLGTINHDLRASISAERSNYVYFKVLRRGDGYTDVSLEVPSRGDFWQKSWYRVENGRIHPQSAIMFNPIFGLTVAFLPTLAGAMAVVGIRIFETKQRSRSSRSTV